MNWNEKILLLISQNKWTQKDLAQKSGITEASVSRYLSGERTPRIDIIVNFAKALNVSVDYLLNDFPQVENAYASIAEVIARNGSNLTIEEKTQLIQLILSDSEPKNVSKS